MRFSFLNMKFCYYFVDQNGQDFYVFLDDEELTPLTVSSRLNGISCSLSFHRDYNIKFVALLKEVPCY